MRTFARIAAGAALACCGLLTAAGAQEAKQETSATGQAPYLNTSLPPEVRAADLVHRMTLEEKASQLVNQARAIPRLNVPAYDWWSEALHGVAVNGTTEFPEPVGLGATFDPSVIHQMAVDIGIEGRIKNVQSVKENGGYSRIMQGLDFWAPNINIFRDPRWGRGQETYGEDPFLTGRMAVAFVTGMQGDDPHYYRVISTPKHFVVHSGPEPTRHMADVDVSKHDEEDTYLPAFRAAVTEGHADSVMCAYNAINGQPACANEFTLIDQLRDKWGFKGYVVSDCGAVIDIFEGHHFRPTQAQASAISLTRGMDNECADFFAKVTDDHDYKPYVDAVRQGYLAEGAIDQALVRLFTARMKLGMFDPPDMVPYAKIDESQLNSAEHRDLARKVADEAMVLLKNDGTLPLKPEVKTIVVVGPLADQTRVLLGNYNGTPTHTVSFMEGLKKEFPNAKITYVAGTQFLHPDGTPIPANLLATPDGKAGLKAEYMQGIGFGGTQPTPITARVEPTVDLTGENLPAETKGKSQIAVQWSGFLTPTESGDYLVGMKTNGFGRVMAADKQIAQDMGGVGMGQVHLEKGQKVRINVVFAEFGEAESAAPMAQLIWAKVENGPSPAALDAARKADVVIAVVGITSQLEGEEMPVNEPGFLGGDRTSINLPQPEEDLVQEVAKAGKPLVVVLMNGSALAVNWEKEHANAILEAWYSGEEGGTAIAETLSGKNDPAGRLPVTFYKDVSQLPNFEDYSMSNRTYRYFKGEPLYPFGYGLSYTTFAYKDLVLPTAPVAAGSPLSADVTVTNTGKVAGDEVVELYLEFPKVEGAPRKALRGLERVHLEAGASQTVHFELKPRDLGMVSELGTPMIADGKYTVTIGGGQPGTGAAGVSGTFEMKGQIDLPE
ncbi:MAG TPA: glycoside hydrolase family 3 C-terminal domain-containing protein [Terracidiphilus sp.]|jgi:beta-glucosidase|nr:glycoside hydrolase family 3 C-terminal domain-containing protein [Terracidiphilus sp.]